MNLRWQLVFSLCLGAALNGCTDATPSESNTADASVNHGHDGHDHGHDMQHSQVSSCTDVALPSADERVVSTQGLFAVRLVKTSPVVPQKGENAWVLALLDEDGKALSDGSLTKVEPFMPAHGHDGRFAPEVNTGDSPGMFLVERINLWMGGHWEVRVSAVRDGIEDVAVLDVCIED